MIGKLVIESVADDVLLPVAIEANDFRHRTRADLIAHCAEFCSVDLNSIFEGGYLLGTPLLVRIPGLRLLPLYHS